MKLGSTGAGKIAGAYRSVATGDTRLCGLATEDDGLYADGTCAIPGSKGCWGNAVTDGNAGIPSIGVCGTSFNNRVAICAIKSGVTSVMSPPFKNSQNQCLWMRHFDYRERISIRKPRENAADLDRTVRR